MEIRQAKEVELKQQKEKINELKAKLEEERNKKKAEMQNRQ